MKSSASCVVKSGRNVAPSLWRAMFLLPAFVGGLLLATAATADPQSLQAGKATVERLGSVFTDGAGPMINARAGDWRLANEHLSLTFVSVDDQPTTISQPIGGWLARRHPELRVPGALIDIAVDDDIIDFLGNFTQGVGLALNGPVLAYDTVEPVRQGSEVGLRLEGSPFEAVPVRMETVYWLAEGRYNVRVESRFLDAPADRPMPEIVDVGNWGRGRAFLPGRGFVSFAGEKSFRTSGLLVRGGDLVMGIDPQGGSVQGNFIGRPSRSRLMAFATPVAEEPEDPLDPNAPPLPEEDIPELNMQASLVRDLWFGGGWLESVCNRIYADRDREYGTFSGRLLDKVTGKPITNAWIEVMQLEAVPRRPRAFLLTIAGVDAQGRYQVNLPPGSYAFKPTTGSAHGGSLNFNPLKAGQTIKKDLVGVANPGLKIQVVDAATAQPLAARLRFEAIAPTAPARFGTPHSARAYLEYATIEPSGGVVNLPVGQWVIHASKGPRYEVAQFSVEVTNAPTSECVIFLEETNPTPGWESMAIGVRTHATPGVAVKAEDMALMAAAEGLDWLVSGDFETITDLNPFIKKLGLSHCLTALRGFRTLMPSRPEWGQFLVFPVADDAPDPASARLAWENAQTSDDFFKALRAAYPGAMIQVELPYTRGAKAGELGPQGYFAMPGKNVHEISSAPNPELSMEFDAINILPDRQVWNRDWATSFYYNHAVFARSYLASTSATGRMVLGSEPGYPRLLALTGRDEADPADQAALMEALKARRTQLTTGPVIDFSVGGALPGGLVPLDKSLPVQLRVTAPAWISVDMVSVDKDNNPQLKSVFGNDTSHIQRYPTSEMGDWKTVFTLGSFRPVDAKDTLLGVTAVGKGSLDPHIPRDPESAMIPSFANIFPVAIDANGNGKYDPLKSYSQKGR